MTKKTTNNRRDNDGFLLMEKIRAAKDITQKRSVFRNAMRVANLKEYDGLDLAYFPEAALMLILWNEYRVSDTIGVSTHALFCLSTVINLMGNEYREIDIGNFKKFMDLAAEVKVFSPPRPRNLDKHVIGPEGIYLRQFFASICGIDNLSVCSTVDNGTVILSQAALEKHLISIYGVSGFYELFIHAVPKQFWFNPKDRIVSRYHFALTRMWPDVQRAFFACEINRGELKNYAEKQDYIDAYSDVMRQVVMNSLSGEVKGMNSLNGAVAQKSRQFILKFMMDSEQMTKAYINIAKIRGDRLPDSDRTDMYKKAIIAPDPTEIETAK